MNLSQGYRNLQVKRKLQLIIMGTVAVALTLACTAVLAYDQYSAAAGNAARPRHSGGDLCVEQHCRAYVWRSRRRGRDSFGIESETSRHQRCNLWRRWQCFSLLIFAKGQRRLPRPRCSMTLRGSKSTD